MVCFYYDSPANNNLYVLVEKRKSIRIMYNRGVASFIAKYANTYHLSICLANNAWL